MKHLLHTIITAAAGFIFFFIGELIYNNLIVDHKAPLTLPLYFITFIVFMSIVLWVLSIKRETYFETRDKKKQSGTYIRNIVIITIIMGLSSGLLEFIYELGGDVTSLEATSYIFLIDDSGSMNENDPKNERQAAIGRIMSNSGKQLPYSVYLFTSGCDNVKSMSTDLDNNFTLNSNGGTDIVGALKNVYADYEQQRSVWGSSPKVLLLTDGVAPWLGLRKVLKKYRETGISVSTVGFGTADANYLSMIADKTGGVFISSDNIDSLETAMEQALLSYSQGNRNLLSDRFCSKDGLYAFLRILFLILISAMFALIKSFAMFDTDRQPLYMLISFALGVIASVLMEVLISHVSMPIASVHCICCILWAIVPAEMGNSGKSSKTKFVPVSFDDDSFDSDLSGKDRLDNYDDDDDEYGINTLDF